MITIPGPHAAWAPIVLITVICTEYKRASDVKNFVLRNGSLLTYFDSHDKLFKIISRLTQMEKRTFLKMYITKHKSNNH